MSLPRSLSAASNGGVFFLYGGDEFRKAAAARALVEQYADSATRDFNVDVLRGSETSVERLASVISTPPMMADWRVVLVREAEALASSPAARKVVLDAAASPPGGLVLILQATVPKQSRAKFYKDLARIAQAAEFRPVPADAIPAWLVSWADRELGATIEIEAAQALAGAAGTNLGCWRKRCASLPKWWDRTGPWTWMRCERADSSSRNRTAGRGSTWSGTGGSTRP